VFGWKLVNTRLLADSYAQKAQALVYLPEFQHGRSSERWPRFSNDLTAWDLTDWNL